MKKKIKIGKKFIGDNFSPFIIAEIGQAHDGSLGLAHSYIDEASIAGADAIKFQTHYADEESTLDDKFRKKFSFEDKNRFDYWKRIEFDKDGWRSLKKHAEKKNLIFLSSPFSVKAVKILNDLDILAWKIGSGDTQNFEMIDQINLTNKPILMSTGMSSDSEIEKSIKHIKCTNIALLYCISKYPSKLEDIDINQISNLKSKFKIPVGFSDHSGSIYPSQIAMTHGASLIEVHVNFHKNMFGPDSSSSVTFDQLRKIVDYRDALIKVKMKKKKIIKDKKLIKNKKLFSRSYALKYDLKKGDIINKQNITLKKPGIGFNFFEKNRIIGKFLTKNKSYKRIIKASDLTNKK
jgi:N,N'-diacetyllegionaminate synthase